VAASDTILRSSTKILGRDVMAQENRRRDFYGVSQVAWLVTQKSVAMRAAEQATTTG
jgi:hypothetical protein